MFIGSRYRNRSGFGGSAPATFLGTRLGSGVPVNYQVNSPYREECVDGLHPGPPFRSGGGLWLRRARYTHWPSGDDDYFHTLGRSYSGRFTTGYFGQNPESTGSGPGLYEPNLVLPSHTGDGAVGWNRFKPGKPYVDLGQAIGELHQIPTLPTYIARMGFFKNLGSNYLNVEFGWKPFLDDLHKLIRTQVKLYDHFAQLKRDNGKFVRRRGTIEDFRSEEVTTEVEGGYPTLTSVYYVNPSAPGQRTVTITRTRRRWFSAAFRYWIPDIDEPDGRARAFRKLLGLNPTPSLVWELTPWSWLADWSANIGDIMSNISGNAAENLVARYAYNMSTYTRTDHVRGSITVVGARTLGGPLIQRPVTFQAQVERTVKLRTAANPFGFGLSFNDLSDRQMLILAALGVTRR